MEQKSPEESRVNAQAYWRANVTLIVVLVSLWFLFSLVLPIFFVEQLNKISIGHLPFGFWMAQQGSIVAFVLLILAYVIGMKILDKRYGLEG